MTFDEWIRLGMTFDDWIRLGIESDYCGPPVCDTHDGTPLSDAEVDELDYGGDPCIHIIRLYPDSTTKYEVERDHSPSQWRKGPIGA